ncbi:MAG: asparagine--tRNA ligase [Chitinispirillia bacterium]|nr:asparagine--tRNA ligase [Chitinispirillia bacterium]MCL2268476.1 asparagine--tRNA ligase [Chitinispirillia bacterium]
MQNRIADILASAGAGAEVVINGWVRTRRDGKGFSFFEVNDGSCLSGIQAVVPGTLGNYESQLAHVTTGSSVRVRGTLVDSPGQGQKYELQASEVFVYGMAPSDYPLQKKKHSLEYLREIAHLRPRTNTIGAVARLRNSLSYAVHSFFQERGFFYVHTPIITASDCEGAGEMFRVSTLDIDNPPRVEGGGIDYGKDFFGKPANLTVSGQLEGETYAMAMGRIYTFGPTFRAENSNTARHLAEFWMIEPEAAFFRLKDDMDLAEDFIRCLCKHALDNNKDDLEFFNRRVSPTVISNIESAASQSFERITYTEAIDKLLSSGNQFQYPVSWGVDIQSEHERYLTEVIFKKPVIVYDYPKEIKAFYMRLNDDGKTVGAMDILVPGIGELVGGSEREDRVDVLISRMRDFGLDESKYWWYLDLRKYGGAPHAGFGLGFERMMLFVTGLQNIRDVIPYPRYPGNAEF